MNAAARPCARLRTSQVPCGWTATVFKELFCSREGIIAELCICYPACIRQSGEGVSPGARRNESMTDAALRSNGILRISSGLMAENA